MKITIVKNYRDKETLRTVDVKELAGMIADGDYRKEIDELRSLYPLLELKREDDGQMSGANSLTDKIPRVCFASVLENKNKQRVNKAYTGLVLLEVNNLTSLEEAEAIRNGAALMPQTLLAFVGASGRSVKIVVGGEWNPSAISSTDEDAQRSTLKSFHTTLYEKARMGYNAQLGVTIEKLEPSLERTCYLSADADMVYNPHAIPLYVDLTSLERQMSVVPKTTLEPKGKEDSTDRYWSMERIFEFNLSKAYDDMEGTEGDEHDQGLLVRLAEQCRDTGLPMGIAQRMAEWRSPFRKDKNMVALVFANAYREQNEEKRRGRKKLAHPLRNVPAETLLTMKIDVFLRENYELRRNVMRGVAEFRERTGLGFDFRDLTEEARNSITLRALEQGIKCWDKDIRRYVCSDDIEHYDPMEDFLEHLPRWDGKDRVTELATRVHTDYEAWPHLFHIWMLSMVAMWQGKGQLTGNALVPLLIGRQGCGKSSFCRILLPREQREYYNDRINFKNEADLNLGLTSFALINLDEFDKITQRQQIVLKYLVSTADLKYRPPYGKAYQQHRRYASFIGTTNEPMPLTDPSGSRRFVCVQVAGSIDFHTPIDYRQLYAQLVQELADGTRYWLTKDEEQALMTHNLCYQQLNGLSEMLLALYRKPEGDEEGQWLSLKDISARMKEVYKDGYSEAHGMLVKIGGILSQPEYEFDRRRKAQGMEYRVVERCNKI
jgi:hypothetical protein